MSAVKKNSPLRDISLNDKYTAQEGAVYLNGTQALVRMMLMQKQADERAGLNTAGYVTGYRGSPLGTVDQTFSRASAVTEPANIRLHPAVNEDLAATAIWGTQQLDVFEPSNTDGVFSMWYGKGPGVHRTGDVFLHANLAGTSSNGGVLAIAGDDHLCKSSTNTHQSEFSFVDAMIPTLNPAGLQDMLDLSRYGWAMSRYSGCWSAMKVTSETLDSSGSVFIDADRNNIVLPEDFAMPADGLNMRWPDKAVEQEKRLHQLKLPAALAFARANRLDRVIVSGPARRIGIVSTGKSYLDTLQAFEMLGLTEHRLQALGVSLYKVALVWPLEPQGIKAFCEGLEQMLVIEEKRALIEPQLKDILYNIPANRRPTIFGKNAADGTARLPTFGELTPSMIAHYLGAHIPGITQSAPTFDSVIDITKPATPAASRTPYFCSGCPHNASTKVPENSKAFAGIGCHYMTLWMDRKTEGFTHMGGEGANWIGLSPHTGTKHMFQNMGDGTYFHSGYLAIRAAIAAGVNMTYKILFNDAVAMTGGQPMDGDLTPRSIAHQLYAEGAKRIAIVAEDIGKYSNRSIFPPHVTFHPREAMDAVQQELREIPGVTAIIFDQMCAAEKRRHRKRGTLHDPDVRMVINDLVCEGCGDCSKTSNCLSVTPVETEFGTKRKIDQSTCNKDYTCVNGFCPSFVTVTGGTLRKAKSDAANVIDANIDYLPEPVIDTASVNLLVTGIGGTGVITIGGVIAMAAHIEGKGCSTLDMTGMAQKGGPVTSHIKIAPSSDAIKSVRIAPKTADVVLGCDMVVTAGTDALSMIEAGRTQVILNSAEVTTSQFVFNRNYQLPANTLKQSIVDSAGKDNVREINASALATRLLGDSIGANLFMVGVAFQQGLLPVSSDALLKAIELNGVAVTMNQRAFNLGRRYAADPTDALFVQTQADTVTIATATSIEELIERRRQFLTEYQNATYAKRYSDFVAHIRAMDISHSGKTGELTKAVARNAFKLMAYKDEYEVARLMTSAAFKENLQSQFEGNITLSYNLAPPLIAPKDKSSGLPRKMVFGAWLTPLFGLLARLKGLRGSAFDIFGYTQERRLERQLRDDYEALITEWAAKITQENYATLVQLACIPDQIRGFGHIKSAAVEKSDKEQARLIAKLTEQPTDAPVKIVEPASVAG